MKQMIRTRFTDRFSVDHPVMLAPMDRVAGGALAAAVARAGGLGLIGGGYGDADWLEAAFEAAGNQRVGVGFITWSLLRQPELIERALARNPAAFMVSFGDATEVVVAAKGAGVPTIWQVQRLEQAEQALAAGVDVIVAQGQEGGGHGVQRGLAALVPAVRDLAGSDAIVLAAGGLADGRGLAAALMLGADGVMLGTRFWASREAEGPVGAKQVLVATGGDATLRTTVFDIARGLDWPQPYTGRVVRNAFCDEWHSALLRAPQDPELLRARYEASDPQDYATRALPAGESLDLVHAVEPAGEILERIVREAAGLLGAAPRFLANRP